MDMPEHFPTSQEDGRRAVPGVAEQMQVSALVSEIWMLVDYIAGNPKQGLSRVAVADASHPGTNFTPTELLREVSDTRLRVEEGKLRPYDRPSMEIMRDALNLLTWPASGLTVAYTTMVSGPLRHRGASRFSLAAQAYPNLLWRARIHRWLQMTLLAVTVAFTVLAAWESAKVALGKALLHNLDALHHQQASLAAEKVKLELSLAGPANTRAALDTLPEGGNPPLSAYRVCDRALVLIARSRQQPLQDLLQQQADPGPRLLFYATPEERDVCGRDDILRANLGIVRDDLKLYTENWPGMVGSGFALLRDGADKVLPSRRNGGGGSQAGQNDIEFRISPVLLVWGNFILPIIFSFIGSAIFVMLDHYNKIRESILDPRDFFLAPVRLALGLVVGACVGLFFSAYGPLPPSTSGAGPGAAALISSLTLTASGVAFLAGFGVETVFSLLEAVITRLFTVPAAAK